MNLKPLLFAALVGAGACAGSSGAEPRRGGGERFEAGRAAVLGGLGGARRPTGAVFGPGPFRMPPFSAPRAPYRAWRAPPARQGQQYEARRAVERGRMAPLGRVIGAIGHRSPGRQLDARLEYQDGRAVYRVLWLTRRGRRIDYIVDAASGRILRGE